jgi:oligoribonuclease NrnB/cAMP/cGMP phosphodiesterase (DHH superfamily)
MNLYNYISNLKQNKFKVVPKEKFEDIKNEIGTEKLIEVPKNFNEDFFIFELNEDNYLLISIKFYEKIIPQNNEKDIYIHQLNKILDRYENELSTKAIKEYKTDYDDKYKLWFISLIVGIITIITLLVGILIGKFLLH